MDYMSEGSIEKKSAHRCALQWQQCCLSSSSIHLRILIRENQTQRKRMLHEISDDYKSLQVP
jgi:hypothetical protein